MVSRPQDEADQFLVRHILKGNDDDFRYIIERYQGEIATYFFRFTKDRHEVEELTQDTFLKAYRRLDTFRGEASFRSWIYGIARNLAIDNYRKRKNEQLTHSEDWQEHLKDASQQPEDLYISQETTELIKRLINKLPTEQQKVMSLRCEYQLNYREISQILHLPLNTVKSRLFRAREKMRELWEEEREMSVEEEGYQL